jgi:hypothetical protein
MNKQLLYSLCLGSLLLAGCSKEKSPFITAGEYETGTVIQSAPIQLFTKDGLVDNPQVVDKFLRQKFWTTVAFSRTDEPYSGSAFKLRIEADKRAFLISNNGTHSDTIKAFLTSQTDRYLVLSYADSVTGRGAVSKPIPGQQSPCELLYTKIKSEYAGVHFYPVAYASGTDMYVPRERPILVISIKNGQLFLPQFSWIIASTHVINSGPYPLTNRCGMAQNNDRNVFNSAVISQLTVGDTIVVQERGVPFQKSR